MPYARSVWNFRYGQVYKFQGNDLPITAPASWTSARSKARRIGAVFCKAIGTTREEIDMTRIRLTGVAALGAALLVFITVRMAQTTAASPTFTKDVAPILYKHCASCHRPGDI